MLKKLIEFLKEVQSELKKVSWPSRDEVTASTVLVIVSSVIMGLFLGLADFVLTMGVEPVLRGQASIWSGVALVVFGFLLFWVYRIIQT